MKVFLISALAFVCLTLNQGVAADDESTKDEVGLSTAELVRLRGYEARDHFVNVTGGYVLNVVEIINPLLERPTKGPVLCIHGIVSSATIFILNSAGARPQDYSRLNASSMSEDELVQLIGDDPTTKSFAYTLANFGYSLWLLNRRGTISSLGTTRDDLRPFNEDSFLSSFANRSSLFDEPPRGLVSGAIDAAATGTAALRDGLLSLRQLSRTSRRNYWNFSVDEQSDFDIPEVIEYILRVTSQAKLSVVTHSLGGAIFLESLITRGPSLESKIHKSINYAPSLYQGDVRTLNPILFSGILASQPFLVTYVGPVPPPVTVRTIQSIGAGICAIPFLSGTLCEGVANFIFGPSGGQIPILPGYFNTVLDSESSHQLAQAGQTIIGNRTRRFDYLSRIRNRAVYGTPRPPLYDPSVIMAKGLSFWAGITDYLVPASNVFQTADDIPVPVEKRLIGGDGVFFNHLGFFFHNNVSRLCVIPSLQTMESGED